MSLGTVNEIKTEYLNRDVNGNPATVKTSAPNDSRVATRQTQMEYCYSGRYVCKSTDPEGYVVQATYDPALGLPLSKKGIDGRWSYLNYDDFGRLIEETLPDGNIISHSTGWANTSGFANALYFVKSESDQMPTVISYYDMNDREIRVEKNGFTGTNIVTTKAYNAKGQLISETLPNYTSPDTTGKVKYEYNDPLNRITLKKYIAQSTTYVYDGFTTTITKPDQHTLSSEYYINGKLKSSSDSKSNKVTYSYHGNGEFEKTTAFSKDMTFVYTNGFKTSMTDPNTGTLNYDNDALGQLRTETDARSQARTFTYDKIGRIITESTSEGTKTYAYVSSGNGAGQILSVIMPKHTLTYTYDANSRLLSLVEVIDDQILTTSYTYDSKGRLETKTYPSGFAIKQVYNNYGYHFQTIRVDSSSSRVIWQLTAKNAFDQTTNYYFGNGVTTSKTYDSYNLLRNIVATNPNATEISKQEIYKYQTEFDPANGNLKFRTDAKTGRNFREDFQYDDLDRLWKITRTGETDKVINYYDNGNISAKFDVGNYAYNATKPNAVENVGNTSPFSSRTQIIEYSTIGKATSIKEGIYKSELIYGLSNERIIMYERLKRDTTSSVYDSLKSTTYYAGDYEIVKNQAGLQTKRHYIFGPDGLIGVYIITTTGSGQLYYTNTDHLGSISVLTDQRGVVVEEYSFDSWGRRRDPNNWSNYTSPINGWSVLLTRGYTFHEHLEKHGLINMNGRLYDPLTGRMLSPDNYVQEPQNTQSHNRYTYAFNNPLKFTDPSGNITWWDVLAVGEIVGGVILGFTPASSLSPSLIASGVNHFAATASVMQDAKAQGYNISYDDASNGVGIGFSYSFTFGGGGSQQKQPPGTTNTPPPPVETSTAPVANVSPMPSGPFLASRGGISDSWTQEQSAGGGKPYNAGEGNMSLTDFRSAYSGNTENEIMTQPMSMMGYQYKTDMAYKNTRFVIIGNGKEIDMIHFMVVGRAGHALGIANEIQQMFRGKSSAFNPQDLYSNYLGVKFFGIYGPQIQQNPANISNYIYDFLSDPSKY